MTEVISQFIYNIFQDNVILATIMFSLLPLIELKGAIPFAMSTDFWGANALTGWLAFLYSFIGCIIITVILAFIFKPIYNAIKDKKFFGSIIKFFTATIKKKSEEVNSNTGTVSEKKYLLKKLLLVLIFVAIPVPGTGVYTGTCLAILVGLNPWWAIAMVTIGNFIAGIIIMTICEIFSAFTTIILYIFILIVILFLVYKIIVHFINKKNEKKLSSENIVETTATLINEDENEEQNKNKTK